MEIKTYDVYNLRSNGDRVLIDLPYEMVEKFIIMLGIPYSSCEIVESGERLR